MFEYSSIIKTEQADRLIHQEPDLTTVRPESAVGVKLDSSVKYTLNAEVVRPVELKDLKL